MNEQTILIPFNGSYLLLPQFVEKIEQIVAMARLVNEHGTLITIGKNDKINVMKEIIEEMRKKHDN